MPLTREEDFNAQLSGSMSEQETSSNSWFKRRKKGISTSTADKNKHPMGFGQNALNASIPVQRLS